MAAPQETMQGKPQLSDLPLLTRYVTGHDPETGKAIVKVKDNGRWQHFGDGILAYNVLYSTTYPESLQNDGDLERHEAIQDTGKLGTVRPNGTVLRVCEFSPGYPGKMHVTRSIDYGIVLEGTVDMILDSGEVQVLKRGDIVVQRATLHQWRNSGTEWVRMAFVLQDVQDFEVNGAKIKEDMGKRDYYIAPSGNTE
jgi:quercetin dioxygenase-like cupin family protein